MVPRFLSLPKLWTERVHLDKKQLEKFLFDILDQIRKKTFDVTWSLRRKHFSSKYHLFVSYPNLSFVMIQTIVEVNIEKYTFNYICLQKLQNQYWTFLLKTCLKSLHCLVVFCKLSLF